MATRPKKETIIPPSPKVLHKASKELRQGIVTGARIEAEESVAKRQHVKPRSK